MSLATRRRNALPVAVKVSSQTTCLCLSSGSYWRPPWLAGSLDGPRRHERAARKANGAVRLKTTIVVYLTTAWTPARPSIITLYEASRR